MTEFSYANSHEVRQPSSVNRQLFPHPQPLPKKPPDLLPLYQPAFDGRHIMDAAVHAADGRFFGCLLKRRKMAGRQSEFRFRGIGERKIAAEQTG